MTERIGLGMIALGLLSLVSLLVIGIASGNFPSRLIPVGVVGLLVLIVGGVMTEAGTPSEKPKSPVHFDENGVLRVGPHPNLTRTSPSDGLVTRWVGQHVGPRAVDPAEWAAIPARSATKGTGYRAYLLTDEWKRRRAIKLRQAGHRCQLCNGTGGLDVHHRTYERAGNERIDDLIVLCRSCHDVFHQHRRVG